MLSIIVEFPAFCTWCKLQSPRRLDPKVSLVLFSLCLPCPLSLVKPSFTSSLSLPLPPSFSLSPFFHKLLVHLIITPQAPHPTDSSSYAPTIFSPAESSSSVIYFILLSPSLPVIVSKGDLERNQLIHQPRSHRKCYPRCSKKRAIQLLLWGHFQVCLTCFVLFCFFLVYNTSPPKTLTFHALRI